MRKGAGPFALHVTVGDTLEERPEPRPQRVDVRRRLPEISCTRSYFASYRFAGVGKPKWLRNVAPVYS